jgi:transposase
LDELHKSPVAADMIERVGMLYGIEDKIRGHHPDHRRAVRQERSRPVLDEMKPWLEQTHRRALAESCNGESHPLRARALDSADPLL